MSLPSSLSTGRVHALGNARLPGPAVHAILDRRLIGTSLIGTSLIEASLIGVSR